MGTELEIRVFLRQNIKKSYWNLPEILGKRVINKHLDETFFYDVEEEQELEDIDENNLP